MTKFLGPPDVNVKNLESEIIRLRSRFPQLVSSDTVSRIVTLTQSQYEELTPDSKTLYVIVE